jgi:hypothetical protein
METLSTMMDMKWMETFITICLTGRGRRLQHHAGQVEEGDLYNYAGQVL